MSRNCAAALRALKVIKEDGHGKQTYREEFKREAVRVALTSGLPRKEVASDLGIGLSTLGKWIKAPETVKIVPDANRGLALENEKLRKENKVLKDERETFN